MACRTAFIIAIAAALLAAPSARAQGAGEPTGVWLTQAGDARVQVSKCGGGICGVIVGLKDPIDPATGKPQVDDKNPNPALTKAADDRPAAVQRHAARRCRQMVGPDLQRRRRLHLREQRLGDGAGYAAGRRLRRRALRRRDLDARGALKRVRVIVNDAVAARAPAQPSPARAGEGQGSTFSVALDLSKQRPDPSPALRGGRCRRIFADRQSP